MLPGFVHAQLIDKEFYDAHHQAGAYLDTHAKHMQQLAWARAGERAEVIR
jgi:hypothetical protein